MSYESELARIESIAAELENGELPLDRALQLFGEGVERLRAAAAALGTMEARLAQLTEEGDGRFVLTDLDG